MRITYLYLAGQGAWPNLQMDALAPQLNVLFGPPRAGKSTIAQLASHLLYGKTSSYWRQQFGQMIPRVEGSLGIEARTGSYVLRRHYDSGAEQERARLTIAATSGGKIDSGTVRSLLSGLSPRLALQLFSVDFAESPRIGRLLVDPFAQLLIRQSLQKTAPQTSRTCWNGVFEYRRSDAFDRRRVDELVRQRDILAQELLQLEETIQELLPVPESVSEAQCVGDWRASDVLARLTHGNLVQVWLDRRHHRTYVVDQHGRALSIDSLTSAQYDQLYLALTLALVSSYAQQGIQLPLILDEPFLRQDAAEVEVMAGILDDFACAGHQLLVFTEDHEARRRFASFGTAVFALEELHENRSEVARATTLAVANPVDSPAKLEVTTGTRVVRKSLDGRTAPILRIAKLEGDGDRKDVFYLNESSSWEEFPVLGSETAALFALIDIHSVGDLLAADPAEIARQLCQPDIQCDTVQLWQSHMGLMCHVPELTLHDAQLLTIAGIFSPEQLMDVDLEALSESIEKSLATERGRRYAPLRHRYSRSQLSRWRQGARRCRQHYQRFTLQRESDVEAAPSIGPKTADRLAKVGIRTVADLLNSDPESTAEELNVSHITAKTIAVWQHQSRLVCQIPELPGYAAQLFVANGFTEPEQIASASTEELVERILTFCQTKKGQRILRSSDAPEADKIAAWIECAAHRRPLEAA